MSLETMDGIRATVSIEFRRSVIILAGDQRINVFHAGTELELESNARTVEFTHILEFRVHHRSIISRAVLRTVHIYQ